MKYLKYLLFLFLIAVIGIAIYIAVQPNSISVSRERTINAPVSVLYDNVIDFKNWESWSPWVEKNPETDITLGTTTKGVGGYYNWEDSHGKGGIKTLNTILDQTIEQELQFGNYHPSKIEWTFQSISENKTHVIWKMNSDKLPFLFKATTAVSGGFDKMIGPEFERGLEKLDSVVVSNMHKYTITIEDVTEHGGGFYLYNTTSCKISEMQSKMTEMFSKLFTFSQENSITNAGGAFTIYHNWDEENGAVMFSSCIPTTAKVITTGSNILTGKLKPFKAVKTTLKGDYINLREAWDKTFEYIASNKLETLNNGIALEVYLTDLTKEKNPANWKTEIFVEIK